MSQSRTGSDGKLYTPICLYCNSDVKFSFENYGNFCVNEQCEHKDEKLLDSGYRALNQKGLLITRQDRDYIYHQGRKYDR